jgi:hypothetical protein
MAALLRLVGPAVARYLNPGPDDLLDTLFDGLPMPVTAEVYPFAPATRITGHTLLVNGAVRDFTSVSGQSPTWLQFNLGGDPAETTGGINTLTLSVTDDAGATTHFSLRYFRLAGSSPSGTPATTPQRLKTTATTPSRLTTPATTPSRLTTRATTPSRVTTTSTKRMVTTPNTQRMKPGKTATTTHPIVTTKRPGTPAKRSK